MLARSTRQCPLRNKAHNRASTTHNCHTWYYERRIIICEWKQMQTDPLALMINERIAVVLKYVVATHSVSNVCQKFGRPQKGLLGSYSQSILFQRSNSTALHNTALGVTASLPIHSEWNYVCVQFLNEVPRRAKNDSIVYLVPSTYAILNLCQNPELPCKSSLFILSRNGLFHRNELVHPGVAQTEQISSESTGMP